MNASFEVSHSLTLDRAAREARYAGVEQEYADGVPIASIADKYGISEAYVIKIARAASLTRNKSRRLLKPVVVDMYRRGDRVADIVEATGVDRKTVWAFAKEAGLELRRGVRRGESPSLPQMWPTARLLAAGSHVAP
jgi:hypothetical protein